MFNSNVGRILLLLNCITLVISQTCPNGWKDFHDSCYKFTRTPLKNREEAREKCQAYNSDLVSVNTIEEHTFLSDWLRENDPQHRRWYTSGRDDGDNIWIWDSDNSQFSNTDALWLPDQDRSFYRHAAYNYSTFSTRWGLQKVSPSEQLAYICEILKEKLHQLIITERDIDYGILILDKEKIPRGPYFTHEPEPVVFDLSGRSQNNDMFLRCVAEGYPSPQYKWYKEEYYNDNLVNYLIDPLEDARFTQTDGMLIINNPHQNKDRGKYHCTATNKFGTIVSQTVQLSFGYIGEFNKKRSPDFGKENWGKSISCDPPQHYPRVNFYWTRNSFPNFVEEDRRVFVSHDGNLYFSSLEKVDLANYSCNVQSVISSTGRTGPFFSLNVEPASSGQKLLFPNNFPKAFPEAPLAGEEVRLECVAYGYPTPSYNWTRRGIAHQLPHGAYTISYDRVLILPKVRVEDMGEYVCTANNGFESTSKAIPLSIQAKPEFTIHLGNKVIDKGSSLTWTCEAFGIPDVTYSWLKNGYELKVEDLDFLDKNRYRIYENVLTIDDAIERDEGMYQCKANSQLGAAYTAGQLRVITLKPSFEKYPVDPEMYAAENGNITIPCRPEAAPFPEITWKRNGFVLSSSGRMRILSNGYLVINPVKREDEGHFICMARNQYGTDESGGLLLVLGQPRLIDPPRPRVQALVNDTLQLRCEAHVGEVLDLAYIWLQNGLRIDFNKQPQFSVGDYQGYLRIHNITLAEAGVYYCIVKTSVGRITASTEVYVMGPPGSPGAVLAEDLNATSARIHWSDGSDNGRRILAYTVEGRTNHNSTWLILQSNVSYWRIRGETGRREISLDNVLSPWSTYTFRVSAINQLGRGPPSDPSPAYNTEKDKPYIYPSNVGGGGGKIGSLMITWDSLPPQEWNAPEIWYKIFYRPAESKAEFRSKELQDFLNIDLYVVNVGEDNYYKPYTVMVQAINSVGYGPISPEVEIFSAEHIPQVQPSQVKALPYNSTALNVSWNALEITREKIRGKLIGHRIKYWRNGDDKQKDFLILLSRGTDPWGLIVGLQPNTEYYVAVMAYNDAGSGVESEPFLARTFKAAPLRPPTSVTVKAISGNSVLVTWRGVLPSSEEEPIIGYKVRYWESDQDLSTAKEVKRFLDGKDLEAVVSGLAPGKAYKLRVMAFSMGGDGKMSSPPWEFKVDSVASPYSLVSSSSVNMPLTFLYSIFILWTIWRHC